MTTLSRHMQHNGIKHRLALLAACVAMTLTAIVATGCGGKMPLKTGSSGAPYEVTVVGDSTGIVARVLSAAMPGLPQEEPMFDVVEVKGHGNGAAYSTSRNIVKIDIDPKQYAQTTVKYAINEHAEPQIVVRVCAPSAAALRRQLPGKALVQLLCRHEMGAETARLGKRHNPEAERTIEQMFGCRMLVPPTMKASLKGKDFLWLTDNASTGMTSICIYTSENRDSVMQANIKGETDAMHMTTTPNSTTVACTYRHGSKVTMTRGLWEMLGDAMGGPFVSHAIAMPHGRGVVVAEAFVYAPEMRKRNLIRRAEASLYTLRTDGKNSTERNDRRPGNGSCNHKNK